MPSAEGAQQKPRRSTTSIVATPSRIQAKRNTAKDVVYIDESSDEIAASVSGVPILDKDKGKKRRITDSEDSDYLVAENTAPKRRKVETKKGVYKLDIPVHVHVPRRRLTTTTQSDATSRDAVDMLWNDDSEDGTTEPSEVQPLAPRPAPKSKQRPRRSVMKTIVTTPLASSSPARTRVQGSKAVPGSPVEVPPTPLSDTSPAFIPTSILLPASNSGVPPFDLASFKAEIRAEVTKTVAAQFVGIREEIFMMRACIEALGQNGDQPSLAEIEAREAVLAAKEEEYGRLKSKEAELVKRLAALDTRYQEMEQELTERFATKERELLKRASGAQLRIEQLAPDQVDISVDQGAEEMELLVQEISTEEATNYEVPIQQGEPFAVVSQADSIIPLRVLKPQESEEVTFQEALVVPAEIHTVEDRSDKGLNSGGNDGRKISSTTPMVNGDYELHPGLEKIPGVHSSVKAAEGQAASGSLMRDVIDLQVSKHTGSPDSDEDAEAEADVDVDVEAIRNSAFAGPANE